MSSERIKLNKKLILYLIIVSTLIICLPAFFRIMYGNDAIAGITSYEHLELATQNTINPYYILMNLFGNEHLAAIILPIILSLGSIILVMSILEKINIDAKTITTTIILLAASPVFIYSSFMITPFTLSLLINLGIILLLLQDKKQYMILSAVLMFVNSLLGINYAILNFLVLLTYCLSLKKQYLILLLALMFSAVATFIKTGTYIKSTLSVSQLFSDFGAVVGFGILEFLLIIIGAALLWKQKKKLAYIFLVSIIILVISILFEPEAKIMLMPLFAFFIAVFFMKIYQRQWKIKIIKTLSILLLICGILFSDVSYINRISRADPTPEIIESLEWIKENADHHDTNVFSVKMNKAWIVHVAESNMPEINYNDTETIYYSRNLEKTEELLDKYNITYIWIDKKTNEKLLAEDEKGLLFLFTNNETFKKPFFNNNTEIWRYYSDKNRISELNR